MERRHYRFIEVVPDGVSQGPDGIVQDEQVLMLVLAEGEDKGVQDVGEVGHQLCASLLLQGRKGTEGHQMTGDLIGWRGILDSIQIVPIQSMDRITVQLIQPFIHLHFYAPSTLSLQSCVFCVYLTKKKISGKE